MSVLKPTRFYSKRQEDKVAKTLGGKRVVNSGATTFSKGDVTLKDWLIECKTCTKEQKTFTIRKEWIDKNIEEAFAMRKNYNAIAIDFGDGTQNYLISEKLFKRLVELIREDDYGNQDV